MALFTKNETDKLQAELSRLEKRKATLIGKLEAAKKAEDAAREAQRRFFVDGDEADVATAAKLAASVTAAASDMSALVDAIQTVDSLIAEGKAAITAAKESAARAKRAAEIAKRIERIEPLAATAEKQFEALVATLERIAAEADDDALDLREYRELIGHDARLPATALVAASLAESIFRDMPDLLRVAMTPGGLFARASLNVMTRRHGGLSVDLPIDKPDGPQEFTPLKLSGALTENIIAPLKSAAAEILAGSRPLATAKTMIEDDREIEPVFEHKLAVLTKPIKWRDHRGEWREHSDTSADLPWPVVDAAFAAGAAVAHTSPEAAAKLEQRYQLGFHSNSINMSKQTVTLDVKWPSTTARAAA